MTSKKPPARAPKKKAKTSTQAAKKPSAPARATQTKAGAARSKTTPSTRKEASIAAAKDQLPRLVHDAEGGAAVHITRRGQPVAVLLSMHDYQRLGGDGPSFWSELSRFRHDVFVDNDRPRPRTRKTDNDLDADLIDDDTFARERTPGRAAPFADSADSDRLDRSDDR